MNPDQPSAFVPKQGSPASPFDDMASPFADQANSPHSLGSAAGSNSPTNRFADNDAAAQSQNSQHSPASAPRPAAAAAAAVKAPWDDDDDDWNTPAAPAAPASAAPASPPATADKTPAAAFPAAPAAPKPVTAAAAAPPAAPAAPAAVPPPPSQPSQDSMSPFSGSPAEPRASPQSPPHGGLDDFIAQSPPQSPSQGSPNRPPTPPEKVSAASTAKMDALDKQIANRTAAFDAATKEKESKILAAAQEYIKAQKTKREKEVAEAKANHKKEQQADANKIDAYKKSGAVWNAVGMLVDLQKPNQYSKGTEQMRSILSTLNTTPAAPATAAAVKK